MNLPAPYLVVVGASSGGVAALVDLAALLPRDFAAPVCMVLHVGQHQSLLPALVRARGRVARHAVDGEVLAPGVFFIAPPDHHMVVEGDRLRLHRGPKENHARPAIDPLFRSAALHWEARAIGVILTGQLDDGAAGLATIKECGGTALVQSPATAAEPDMPTHALQATPVDHCLPLEELAQMLCRLVSGPAPPAPCVPPPHLVHEHAMQSGRLPIDKLAAVAQPSTLTCPDCGGTLWQLRQGLPVRFRCHTGHAFSALSLTQLQLDTAEQALRSAVRALHERELLLRRLADLSSGHGDAASAAAGRVHADAVGAQVTELLRMIESEAWNATRTSG